MADINTVTAQRTKKDRESPLPPLLMNTLTNVAGWYEQLAVFSP